MRPLIVATATTPPSIVAEIDGGVHQRVDYIELARQLKTTFVDYNVLAPNRSLQVIEDRLRMDLRLATHVAREIRRERYDVIVCLSERVALPLSRMTDPKVKLVVIVHHAMSRPKLMSIKLANGRSRWTRIAAISTAEANALRSALQLPPSQVQALHTPVDTSFFDEDRLGPDKPTESDHIQSLGLSHRDYPTLLRAMRTLPHIQCWLRVGSTWTSQDAGFTVSDLPANVSLQPYLHPSQLRASYAESRFIVVPIRESTQWSAGCTSVQQAQAMGKAVVATAMPGLSEYIENGVTGLLVEVGDDRGLANAIEYLWNNPDVARQMGEEGRRRMLRHHALDDWIDEVQAMCEAAKRAGVDS
jgi:glycosyltransferase involved in cell wall biosynthesis